MALTPGTRLGVYEVTAPIGQGGMGEVYRARDTKLNRDVALKSLPDSFAADPDRLARFTREAQTLAALNHPHIAHIHGLEESGGVRALVMELVEGEDLSQRLARGAIPLNEAVEIARQIAEALEYAHEHGVVHRDLKPANVKLAPDGTVKVLDFGLAKAADTSTASRDAAVSPTLTMRATEAGVILGTAAYMAPEQASGRAVDHRADIWSFGVVLWEMLSGRRLFDGETVSHTLADVLRADIDVSRLPAATPPAIRTLLGRCLDRNLKTRLQAIGEARIALQAFLAAPSADPSAAKPEAAARNAPVGRGRRVLPWAVAAAAMTALLALAVVHLGEQAPPVVPYRYEIPVPEGVSLRPFDLPTISPDGRTLAFVGARAGGRPQLWVRRLDSLQAAAVPGTEGAASPFWSPDSRFVGFVADDRLMKVESGGGPVLALCNAPCGGQPAFGSWSRDGAIIFSVRGQPRVLQQISASGGAPTPLLKLDEARKERRQEWPRFLPDGRHFVFTSLSLEPGLSGIYVGALGSNDTRLVVPELSNADFVPPGSLVFGRGQALVTQPFDPASLQLAGEAAPVVDSVGLAFGMSLFSASDNGVLVYRQPLPVMALPVWYDRQGRRLGAVGEPRPYLQFGLSPDERRIAAQVTDTRLGTDDIWVLDLASGILSRMTSDRASEDGAVWSPDGREILYSSARHGPHNLYRKVVGGGDEQRVLPAAENQWAELWLQDGSFLFVNQNGRSFNRLRPGEGATPETLLTTEYSKDEPRVSPDGRWIAYNTDESGRWEVYVARFPSFTDRRQVSTQGGSQGYWRQDGRELFYLALDGKLMSVPITPGPPLEAGIPQALFATRVSVFPTRDHFAATRDGQRFLVLEPVDSAPPPFGVLLNWQATVSR